MGRSLKRKARARTALFHGLLAVAVALAAAPAFAQPQGGHQAQRQHHGAQPHRRQAHPPRHRVERQHRRAERNRYEWRRDRYQVVRRPAAPLRGLPPGHARVHIGKRSYYVHRGHYYVRHSSGFVLVAPPVGVVVATLPVGAISLRIGGVGYFLAGGVYYRHASRGYVVVTAPRPAPYAVSAAAQQVVVQAAILNVRSGPSLGFTVVARTEQGVSLPVFGNAPGWYYVRLPDGTYGWVMAQYTIPVQVAPSG